MSENAQDTTTPTPKIPGKIIFSNNEVINSRLKYYIRGTGLQIDKEHNRVSIQVYNSRDELTVGYIDFPKEDIPQVVEELMRIHRMS